MIATLDTTDIRAGLIQFSAAIYDPGDIIEIREIKKGEEHPRVKWTTAADLPDLADVLASDNADGWNIYASINPRPAKHQRTDEAIELARVLFVDFDDTTLADALAKCEALGLPAPTLVIESGHGVHFYWRLTDPIDDLAAWAALQWDLAIATGADVKVRNPERIMRLPGFTNWKYEPVPCRIVEANATRRVSFDELRAIVPKRPEPKRPHVPQVALPSDPGNTVNRCIAYLAKCGDSIEGQRGHDALYRAAMETMRFALGDGDGWQVMQWFNGAKCSPAWSDRELRHKLDDARKNCNGEWGMRLREDRPRNDAAGNRMAKAVEAGTSQPGADPPIAAVGAGKLLIDYPELREPLIDGFLRRTETCNVIAAAKFGKTHTIADLALCVCTGRAWLGRFPIVRPGPVLYIDAELHQNTMARRIASICSARGIFHAEIEGKLDVLSLRGRLRNIFQLRPWLAENAAGKYALIVADALYRLIPEGIDENSNSDMTRVFNVIDQIAEQTGAAILIVHHASKGVQSGKSVVDVGSGASAMARATDSHIIFRPHEETDCAVMELAARSWPPLAPVPLRWNYPTWTIDETLDPTALRQDSRRRARPDSEPSPEPKQAWTPEDFATQFVGTDAKPQELILAKATEKGLTERAAKRLLLLASDAGLVFAHSAPSKTDKKAYFSSVKPTIFTAAQSVSLTHTQPPTPPVCGKRTGGGGRARRKSGTQKNEGGAK